MSHSLQRYVEACIPSATVTLVNFDESLAAIVPSHLAFGANLLRRRNREIGHRWSLCPMLNDDEAILVAKLEHELDHLHRSFATSFGLARHSLTARRVHSFFQRIQAANTDEDIPLPFQAFDKNSAASEHLSTFFNCSRAEELLLGSVSLLARDVGEIRNVVKWFLAGGLKSPHTEPAQLPAMWELGVSDLYPTVPYTLGRRPATAPFGALALLEVFAVFREVSLRKFANVAYDEAAQLLRVPAYQQAGQLWRDITGNRMASVDTASRPGWSHIAPDGLMCFPLEFYAMCDLALWPPVGPYGPIEASGREFAWQDIHPGWRFLRACQSIAAEPVVATPPLGLTGEYEQRFTSAQDVVCHNLGWPPPRELATLWRSELKSAEGIACPTPFVIQDDLERSHASQSLLALRLKSPLMAALGYSEPGNRLAFYFRHIAHTSGGFSDPRITVRTFDEYQSQIAELGYRIHPAYAVVKGCELYAFKGPEELMSSTTRGCYGTTSNMGWYRKAIDSSLANYSSRHYGFRIVSGRA